MDTKPLYSEQFCTSKALTNVVLKFSVLQNRRFFLFFSLWVNSKNSAKLLILLKAIGNLLMN